MMKLVWVNILFSVSVLKTGGSVSSSGYHVLISKDYLHYRAEWTSTNVVLVTHNLIESTEASNHNRIWIRECARHCMVNPDCKSFIVNSMSKQCHLSASDRCQNQGIKLTYYEDRATYELRKLTLGEGFHTCYGKCLLESSYENCGKA